MLDDRLKAGLLVIPLLLILSAAAILSLSKSVEGHGVPEQFQSKIVRIDNEQFSDITLNTGDTVVATGELHNQLDSDLKGLSFSITVETAVQGKAWEIVSTKSAGKVFDIPANGVIPYEMNLMSLKPGVYHVHTQLNIPGENMSLGRGQTINVEGSPIDSNAITWSPKNVTYLATLTFSLPVNFTSTKSTQNVELVPSHELRDLVNLDYFPALKLENITAGKIYHPVIAVEIGPNTTGGWHNGTISVSANGSLIADPLDVNILVPKLAKAQFPGYNGTTIYTIIVPSFSPTFNDTANIFTWAVLANGSKIPFGYPVYDARSSGPDVSNITLQADKAVYKAGENITIAGQIRDYNASKNPMIGNATAKPSLAIYRVDPFVSVYETCVPINDDGTFSQSVLLTGNLTQDGSYDVYFLEKDICFDVSSDVLNETKSKVSEPSSSLERPPTLQPRC